jgi:hypothetical protein
VWDENARGEMWLHRSCDSGRDDRSWPISAPTLAGRRGGFGGIPSAAAAKRRSSEAVHDPEAATGVIKRRHSLMLASRMMLP